MSRIPLLPVTIPFVLGIIMFYAAGWAEWLLVLGIVLSVILYLRRWRMAGVMMFALVAGYSVALLRAPVPLPEYTAGERLYSGVVTDAAEKGAMKVMVVRVDSCEGISVPGFLIKAIVPTLEIPVDECHRMDFVAAVKPLSHDMDLPDEIDYNESLALRGVVGECYVVPDSVRRVNPEPGLLNDIRRFRKDVSAAIAAGSLSPEATDFLIATIAGEREILTIGHRDLFSKAGLAHLLALSGLHVGIMAALLSWLLFPVALWRRWPACVLTMAVLWAFAVMTGLSPSVTRSVIMCSVFLVSVMLQREWSPVNALCIAALIILLCAPYSLFSLGFQMSFMAVLSIIVFADRLNPVSTPGSAGRWAMMLLTVPVAAMLGTGIVGAFHFHTFPLLFLVSNALVSVILPPLLGGGMLKVVLGLAGCPHLWLDRLLDFLYGILHGVAVMVTEFPGAVADNIYVTAPMLAGYFSALLLFAVWLYRRRPAMLVAAVMIAVFTAAIPFLTGDGSGEAELYVTRSHSETTLLVRDGTRLVSFSTAHPSQMEMLTRRDGARYSRYMLRRGIERIEPLADGYDSPVVKRRGNTVDFKGRRITLVSSGVVRSYGHTHYAVVCRGFRGDVVRLARGLQPDSVILGSDLDLRRHNRYARCLTDSGIPFRSLRTAPLILR